MKLDLADSCEIDGPGWDADWDRWRDRQLTMSESNRKTYLAGVRTVVVKLGTQLLAGGKGGSMRFMEPSPPRSRSFSQRLRVTMVSSGAIGSGLTELGLAQAAHDLAKLQAVAAVGQRRLMDVWADAFAALGFRSRSF